MKYIRIKVCGLKEPANVRELAAMPVDLLGFIFYPGSPRFVGRDFSLRDTAVGQERVGVFVDAPLPELLQQQSAFQLDYLQLHGAESPDFCRELKKRLPDVPLIKAVGVRAGFDFNELVDYTSVVDYFLFDTKSPQRGGTGQAFDWALLQNYRLPVPFFLAGGLGPESMDQLHAFAHPQWAGIDLNSRFERYPGHKDARQLGAFIEQLKNQTV